MGHVSLLLLCVTFEVLSSLASVSLTGSRAWARSLLEQTSDWAGRLSLSSEEDFSGVGCAAQTPAPGWTASEVEKASLRP